MKTESIEIKKEPTLDICSLFFIDSVVHNWRYNHYQIDVLHIQISPELVYCDGMVVDENYLSERVFMYNIMRALILGVFLFAICFCHS